MYLLFESPALKRAVLISLMLIGAVQAMLAQCDDPFTPSYSPCDAPIFCQTEDLSDFCGKTEQFGGLFTPTVTQTCTGSATVDNAEWISFVAKSTSLSLEVKVEDCSGGGAGDGLQFQVLSTTDCDDANAYTSLACLQHVTTTDVMNLTGLVPGQQYYIMIDGWIGDECTYEFEVLSGTIGGIPVVPVGTTVAGATNNCMSETSTYSIPNISGAVAYAWNTNNGLVSLVPNGNSVDVTFSSSATPYTAEVCCQASNACGAALPICTTITVNTVSTGVDTLWLCPGETEIYNGSPYSYGNGLPTTSTTNVTLQNAAASGCDSLVVLTIRKLQSATKTISSILCVNETINVCGQNFSAPQAGTVKVCPGVAAGGCDSVYTINLTLNNPVALITPPAQIDCNVPCVGLSAMSIGSGNIATWTWAWSNNVTGATNTSSANACQTGTYTVSLTNAMGFPPLQKFCTDTAQVVVSSTSASVPAQPGPISGTTTPCAGSQTFYTISVVPGATSYTWTVPAGVTISGQGTIFLTVNWGAAIPSGTISVVANNSCGSSPQSVVNINGSSTPSSIGNIGGPTTPCANTTAIYSISASSGASSYSWSVSGGGTITSGQGSTSINVAWGANPSGTVSVFASNGCGASNTATLNVAGTALPGALGAISGNATPCVNASEVYNVAAVSGADVYTWTVPVGVSIVSGQNTNSISINWGTSPGGTISVQASNVCGSNTAATLNITGTSTPPIPDISGNNSVCGNTQEVYGVTNVLSGATYTWVVPASGVIIGGQGTATVTISWGGAPSGTLSVSGANGCGTSSAATMPIVGGGTPAAPAGITGDITVCPNAVETYAVSNPSATTTYTWTIPPGATFSGQGSSSITVTWGGTPNGNITVAANNSCGSSANTVLGISSQSSPATPTTVSGPTSVCAASTQNYTVSTSVGATSYTWSGNNGALVTNGQNSTLVSIALQSGNTIVSVTANNACGSSAPATLLVNAGSNITMNAGADQTLCGLTTSFGATNPSTGTGIWEFGSGPGTATIFNDNNPNSSVSVSTAGVYTFNWVYNDPLCAVSDQVTITFEQPITVSNIQDDCNANGSLATVAFTISGGTPPYTVTGGAGGSVAGNIFTSNPFTPGNFAFTVDDASNCAPIIASGTAVCDCISEAGQMPTDTLKGCIGKVVFASVIPGTTITDANDVAEYVLHTGMASGTGLGVVIARNTSGVFPFVPGPMDTGVVYMISIVVGDNNGFGQAILAGCFDISVGQPVVFYPAPIANAGPSQTVCGTTATLAAVSPYSGFWTVINGPGNVVFSDQNSPNSQITVDVGGEYDLYWTEELAACNDTSHVRIGFNPFPQMDPPIYTCNALGTEYTVEFDITFGTGDFTVVDNATGLPTGTLVGLDFVGNPIPSGNSYDYSLIDFFGCAIQISDSYTCGCVSSAGVMPGTTLNGCEGTTVSTTAFIGSSFLDPDDVQSYILHTSPLSTAGTILDHNSTGIFAFDPSDMVYGQTYYISSVVGNNNGAGLADLNNGCTDVAMGQPVVFYAAPQVTATASSFDICSLTVNLQGGNNVGLGTWSQTAGPGFVSFTNANQPVTDATVSQQGGYSFRYVVNNNGCIDSASVNVNLTSPITASVTNLACNNTASEYTVTIQIAGGTSPYTVNGFAVAGNTYTSTPFTSGTVYTLNVDDNSACPVLVLQDDFLCNCVSNVGTLTGSGTSNYCENQTATATYNNTGEILDPDDIVQFVLHQGSLNNILLTSPTPSFTYQPTLSYNTTYYITAIVGTNDGTGNVDVSDPCLEASADIPVVFIQQPTATLAAPAAVCEGLCAQVTLDVTGGTSFVTTFSNGAVFTTAGDSTFNVCPTADTSLCLTQIADAANVCVVPLNTCANITVSPAAFAGTASGVLEICENVNTSYNLADLLTGEVAGGTWTETSGSPSSGTAFDATAGTFNPFNQVAQVYTFLYTVTGVPPCVDDSEPVVVIVNPAPQIFAGADDTLTCTTQVLQLGPGFTDPQLTYSWTRDGFPFAGNTASPSALLPGTYAVQVIDNTYGCSANDTVVISQNIVDPVIVLPAAWDTITCVQQSVDVDASGTTANGTNLQFTWTLNNTVVDNDAILNANFPGVYVLQVTDLDNGCFDNTSALVIANTVLPQAQIAQPGLLTCTTPTTQVNASGSFSGPGAVYTWTAALGGNITAGDGTSIITVDAQGLYTITVTNSLNGCTATSSATVFENISPPTAVAAALGEINCTTDNINLNGLGSSLGVLFSYQWGTTSGNIVSGANTLNPLVNVAATYTITVSNSLNGCTASSSVVVQANNNQPTDIQFEIVPPVCYGECDGQLIITGVTGGTEPYYFTVEGDIFGDIDTFQFLCSGNYELAVQDAAGCEFSMPVTIYQAPQVTVSLGPDTTITLGDTIMLNAVTNIPTGSLQSVTFSPQVDTTGCNDTLCLTPFIYPPTTTLYTVTVVDTNGCTATDQMLVKLFKPESIFIPNTFSPNNDGFNDYVNIFAGTDVDAIVSFQIFDRWGELMYQRTNVPPNSVYDGWDGNHHGQPCRPGVYVYWCEVRYKDGTTRIVEGDITLLR